MSYTKAEAFFVLSIYILIFLGLPSFYILLGFQHTFAAFSFCLALILWGVIILEAMQKPRSIRRQIMDALVEPPLKAVKILTK